MAFEVRSTTPLGTEEGEEYLVGRFTDESWGKILALARRHGFDPGDRYGRLLRPERDETTELDLVAAQELAVALSELLREETAPGAEAPDEGEDGEQGWVYDPARGWELGPVIRVGPPDKPELQVGWAHVRRLGELAESGPITITRVDDPVG